MDVEVILTLSRSDGVKCIYITPQSIVLRSTRPQRRWRGDREEQVPLLHFTWGSKGGSALFEMHYLVFQPLICYNGDEISCWSSNARIFIRTNHIRT